LIFDLDSSNGSFFCCIF